MPSRFWGECWARGSLGWGMFAGRGKLSGEEFLFAVSAVCASLRFGRGTWYSFSPVMCRVDGGWNTNLGENCTGLRSGKRRRTASFLSGGRRRGGGGSLEMIPCTRLLPYVSVMWVPIMWVMSVCVVTARRCVFVCKWFVSDRVCNAAFVVYVVAVRGCFAFLWFEVFTL